MTVIERKVFGAELKVNTNGELEGYANVFGIVDRGKDVVEAGAFEPVIEPFLKEGFISWHHDWTDPVAMPKHLAEDSTGLQLAAKFHSTERAQEARTIVRERAEAGLRTGLSVGYIPGQHHRGRDGVRHIQKMSDLFEVGIVMVPMNQESNVAAAKGYDDGLTELLVPDAGTASFAESVARMSEALPELVARGATMHDQRTKEGRTLSASNRRLLGELLDALEGNVGPLRQLLDDTDPEREARGLQAAALAEYARSLGVAIPH